MRFKMRVVFPLPRKPVIIVTGVGVMLADGLGNCLKSAQLFVEASWLALTEGRDGIVTIASRRQLPDQVQALANPPGRLKPNATGPGKKLTSHGIGITIRSAAETEQHRRCRINTLPNEKITTNDRETTLQIGLRPPTSLIRCIDLRLFPRARMSECTIANKNGRPLYTSASRCQWAPVDAANIL